MTHRHLPIDSITGFHIEPTNICTLKCPGCARTRFIDQWPQHWQNHSIDVSALMQFLDVDLTGRQIMLCGNYGDPIYHPDFYNLVSQLKQRGSIIHITTNGSYRSVNWWQRLVALLDGQDSITFSVDGIPDNFTQYRINADWESIKSAMTTCSSSAVTTIWKYIPFSYNVNDIDQAQQLSQSLGIKQFQVDPSDRFDALTDHLKPSEKFLGNRFTAQQTWMQDKSTAGVQPKCVDGRQHYISADGYYVPCCYLQDHRFYYKTNFGRQKKLYNITDHTLSEILSRPAVIDFYHSLPEQAGCQFNCPQTA